MSRKSDGIRIIESDGSFLKLASEAGVRNLSQEIQQRWQYAQQVSHRAGSIRTRLVSALASAKYTFAKLVKTVHAFVLIDHRYS